MNQHSAADNAISSPTCCMTMTNSWNLQSMPKWAELKRQWDSPGQWDSSEEESCSHRIPEECEIAQELNTELKTKVKRCNSTCSEVCAGRQSASSQSDAETVEGTQHRDQQPCKTETFQRHGSCSSTLSSHVQKQTREDACLSGLIAVLLHFCAAMHLTINSNTVNHSLFWACCLGVVVLGLTIERATQRKFNNLRIRSSVRSSTVRKNQPNEQQGSQSSAERPTSGASPSDTVLSL
eukprot:2695397-Rhodomonas_salina.1